MCADSYGFPTWWSKPTWSEQPRRGQHVGSSVNGMHDVARVTQDERKRFDGIAIIIRDQHPQHLAWLTAG